MDIFALSSLREGLPNVLLEAMALEVPVVATAIAGVPQLIRDGENGLLVSAGSAAALTPALARLLRDGGLRQRLAQSARRIVETRYSFVARMQKICKIYDRLLHCGSPISDCRGKGAPSSASDNGDKPEVPVTRCL
jgi:glycosyltransferase involved in cell wall biosynthesis